PPVRGAACDRGHGRPSQYNVPDVPVQQERQQPRHHDAGHEVRTTMRNYLPMIAVILAAACTNPEVPQGYEGYIYNEPLLFGKMEFREALRGPATTGVSWRLYTENVDMRAKSYKEDFELLTHDNLNVTFEVNTRIKLKD